MARFGKIKDVDPPFPDFPHPLAVELDRWMTAANEAVDLRNKYLHSIWGMGSDQKIGILTLRRPHDSMPVSVEDLLQLEALMDLLADECQLLYARVSAEVRGRESVVLQLLAEGNATGG